MTKEQTYQTEKERRLINLAETYPTDKLGHGYMPLYAKHLPDTCRSMLEIGVAEGFSALMWDCFYTPDLDLHLIDLFEEAKHVSPRWCRNMGYVPHQGAQQDIGFLTLIKDTFNLIVDDGSHNADHQIESFKHLFLNNLRSGGLYVVEDLHCNDDPFYWNDRQRVRSFENTMKGMMQNYGITSPKRDPPFFEGGQIMNHTFFNLGESEVFENIISRIALYDKIVFIWRK